MPVILLWACGAALAQGPTYGMGRAPSQEEIKTWDLTVFPDGRGLPPGQGTAKQGAPLYARKCASCHGPTGGEKEGEEHVYHRPLVGGFGSLTTIQPVKSIGNYWSYATTIWDYCRRGMPPGQEGSLSNDECYALTAFLLYRNRIIQEDDVMDANSLPKVQMPGRKIFVPQQPEWKPGYYQPYFEQEPIPRVRKPLLDR
ncbi:MAG: c-type cytochrome [Fidelibacterota bacterium]